MKLITEATGRPFLALAAALVLTSACLAQGDITKYVRYSHEGEISYGILEGETIKTCFPRPAKLVRQYR